jgi:hypothetical protein
MFPVAARRVTCEVTALLLALSGLALCDLPAQAQAQKSAVNTAAPKSINSQDDVVQWMTYYYLHPQPDLLVPALTYADSTGLIEKGQAPLTAFVSRVFAQNPGRIHEWTDQLKGLSNRSKPMLWSALWWSSTVAGKESLESLMTTLSEKQATEVLSQMAHPAEPIDQMEIKSPEVLDELWGAFSATGDVKYVDRLITTLPWAANSNGDLNKMMIGSAARWSLTSNAQQHPIVLKEILKERDAQPELRGILSKVIADATKPAAAKTGDAGSSL